MQAQIIALSYQNNSTSIEIATNALGFAGVLLDVITAFLALLASTITQRHVQVVERQLNGIDGLPSQSIVSMLNEVIMPTQPSLLRIVYPDIRRQVVSKCEARLKALQSDSGGASTFQTHTEISISAIVASCQRIQRLAFIGDAAGTAMLFGIICFLSSVLCLAIASQPTAVWTVSAVACSSILALPLVNRVLGLYLKMRSWINYSELPVTNELFRTSKRFRFLIYRKQQAAINFFLNRRGCAESSMQDKPSHMR